MSTAYFQEVREKIKARLKDEERLRIIRKAEREGKKETPAIWKRMDLKELSDRVRSVKEESLKRLDELIKIAMESFARNEIHAYHAKTAKEAADIFLKIAGDAKVVVKSAADVPNEIGLPEILEKRGTKLINTDFGYLLWSFMSEEYGSTKGIPMVHVPLNVMAKKISEKLGVQVKPDRDDIVKHVRRHADEFLQKADVGLTGANAIAATEGAVFLIHDQGNINRVISMPPKHIVMTGIDKVVPTLPDALCVAELASVYQLGRPACNMNIVSAPTQDWNMEHQPAYGIFGAKEIHVILVDNGRREAIKKGYAECLYCMRCFACHQVCPTQERIRNLFGYKNSYVSGRGIILSAFVDSLEAAVESGLFLCTLCGACYRECPIRINIPSMITKLRIEAATKGLVPKMDLAMDKSAREKGNPFDQPRKDRIKWMKKENTDQRRLFI